MSKSVKTPIKTQHKIRVNTLKAQLPDKWLDILRNRLGKPDKPRSRTYVSNLINNYGVLQPDDWREVLRLRDEYQSQLIEAEQKQYQQQTA